MLKFTPMRVLDEMKEQEARQQELATEIMKQTQEKLYENMGNDSISDKLNEQNIYIAKIAEAAKSQSDSAKTIAEHSNSHSCIAILISIFSLLLEVIINFKELCSFFQNLFNN